MPKPIDVNEIVGDTFGQLRVIEYIDTIYFGRNRRHLYECRCKCGNIVEAYRDALLKGDITSCGCGRRTVFKDLTGRRFGRWTVLRRAPNKYSKTGKSYSVMWLCKCDCGVIKSVRSRALLTENSKSCGCLQKDVVSSDFVDLTGQTFGYLTVVERRPSDYYKKIGRKYNGVYWKCRCKCGNIVDVLSYSLRIGDTTSCGCKKQSKYEYYVEQYLLSKGYVKGVSYFKEKTFEGLTGVGGSLLKFIFLY